MLVGQRFGRLLVVGPKVMRSDGKKRRSYWHCLCDCGNTKIAMEKTMLTGDTASCGCLRKKGFGPTHDYLLTPEYASWQSAKARCYNRSSPAYKWYGARGITMSEEWRESFLQFLADMGKKPARTSLDRINTDGPYSKENCRWATWKVQQRNRRNNVRLEFDGQSKTPAQWAEATGIHCGTILARINKLGWTVAEALTTPINPKKRNRNAVPGRLTVYKYRT